VSSRPTFAPSTRNWTPTTAPDVVAAIENAFDTVSPFAGEVIETVIGAEAAVKSIPVTSALLTATPRFVGLNVYPTLLGVTVYDPLGTPLKR
jgi:hypothetical protein